MTDKHNADVTGVSETALMTLVARAQEAKRPDCILEDPMAINLVESIDHDFAKFGFSRRQDVALRALIFDKQTRRYLVDHPKATVVALAEGLQTSFFRLDAPGADAPIEASGAGAPIDASGVGAPIDASGVGAPHQFRWLTVDLPPMIELRRKLLPIPDRVQMSAQSALDFAWMDQVDPGQGVFITAEGLLMYLQPDEALALITECAARFPGGRMMFDLPPSGFAALTRRGMPTSLRYRVPPMPFTLSVSEAANLVNTVPGIRAVHDVPIEQARGAVLNALLWAVQRIPLLDPVRPTITLLEFG
ncbi:MAG: class I SAM-dependent methyltransferase [Actinomycetia bacterium]|nr:class I SAM-dependent methyltransferase [Actinomycetes bacterium]